MEDADNEDFVVENAIKHEVRSEPEHVHRRLKVFDRATQLWKSKEALAGISQRIHVGVGLGSPELVGALSVDVDKIPVGLERSPKPHFGP